MSENANNYSIFHCMATIQANNLFAMLFVASLVTVNYRAILSRISAREYCNLPEVTFSLILG